MGTRSTIFDWARLLGAFLVLFGHSYVLLGLEPPGLFGNQIHTLGVKLFFLISGYLIAGSWRADPDPWRYLEKRARRIMPALIAVVLVTVFVLGPAMTTDPRYWTSTITWTYLWRNLVLLPYHTLPGVFGSNRLTAVNGSLWSLPVEVAMYAATPLIVRAGPWLCLIAAAALIAYPFTGEIAGFGLTGASSVIPCFLIGATAKMLGWRMPASPLPPLPADVSYGAYLMAFPVQQAIIALVRDIGPVALTMYTVAVVTPLALTSWLLIEQPAMAYVVKQRAHHAAR